MPEECPIDCSTKQAISAMQPKVDEIHEIILGVKTAVNIMRGAGWVVGSLGAIVGVLWTIFTVLYK